MAEEGRSWLRYGCFGCAGVIGLMVLVTAGLVGLAAMQARQQELTEREFVPALPASPGTTAELDPSDLDPAGLGRVILDFQGADFELRPAAPGQGLSVSAIFDEESYELIERFEAIGGSDWQYNVEFRQTGMGFLTGLKQALGGSPPEVKIFLPADRALALDVDLRQGALVADLGGLWLRSSAMRVRQGALELTVSEALRAPMDEMTFNVSMGGVELDSLGNASPATLGFKLKMGGAYVDLRGAWVQDSRISFDTGMSGAQVRLPRNVAIEGIDRGSLRPEPDAEVKPPTLFFDIDPDEHGDLEFID